MACNWRHHFALRALTVRPVNEDAQEPILACVDNLLSLLERELSHRVAPASEFPRIYAAAGLLRGADLLGAALLCVRDRRDDVVGVLVRTVIETWFVSLYLLRGGPKALAHLEAQLIRHEQALITGNEINLDDVVDERRTQLRDAASDAGVLDPAVSSGRISVRQIASALADLHVDGEDALAHYELLYRSYSTYDAHALAPILRRLVTSNLERIEVQDAIPWVAAHGSIGIAALLLGDLAASVLSEFEADLTALVRVNEELVALMTFTADEVMSAAPQHVRDRLPPDLLQPPEALR